LALLADFSRFFVSNESIRNLTESGLNGLLILVQRVVLQSFSEADAGLRSSSSEHRLIDEGRKKIQSLRIVEKIREIRACVAV
jgi:hypothetical protein